MSKSLVDRTIIITGASAGIGRATALACADAGMHVVINGRRQERLEELAQLLRDKGRRVAAVGGDVVDGHVTEQLLQAADELGGLDVVFANAGYGMRRAVHDVSIEDLRRIFEVNFFASVELCTAAANRLLERNARGHLLMCSSLVARFSLPHYGPYSATKAAQAHMCQAMRAELKPRGIAVSSVHPIGTRTEFGAVAATLSGKGEDPGASKTPSRFMQKPERVANAVVRCLRKPHPEVWTNFTLRLMAASMTLSPRIGAMIGDRIARKIDD